MDYNEQEPSKKKLNPSAIWKQYVNARDYKSTENLYEIIAQNEAYYAGDQWRGVKSGNLPTPVFNFLEQLVDVKVSSIMADQITIHRKADEVSEFSGDEKVLEGANVFNLADKKNWERIKMDSMNEQMLLDCAQSGAGYSHWYWDNKIVSGNKFQTTGDFLGETIDSVNMYFSNPNEISIQDQDWIIISSRKTIKQVRAIAKANGVPEEQYERIQGDEEQRYEGYDKAQNEQDGAYGGSNLQTVLLKYWKKDGTVWFCKTAGDVVIEESVDTELKLYPIAMMNWKIRKRFIYGTAEITYIIKNQQHVNMMLSMQQLHARLQGSPKLLFNKTVIDGVTNLVGGVVPVRANPSDNIANVMAFKQPGAMSIDVDKSIDSAIRLTREFKGVNDNVLGISRPENTSALAAQQRAAGVPLESIKRRFIQYIEDVALIWMDIYRTKYNTGRKVFNDDGEEFDFTGTDFKDVYLKTKIDVGAGHQWAEPLTMQILDSMSDRGIINPVQYIKRLPHGLIPDQQNLVEEVEAQQAAELGGATEGAGQAGAITDDMLAELYQSLPPEQQQQLGEMPEEEAKEILRRMAQEQ